MAQLTTLTNLKSYLKISDTTDDTLLQSLIDALSNAIEQYLRRYVINTTIVNEIYDCSNVIENLQLNSYPIVSITAMTQNSDSIDLDLIDIDNIAGIIKRNDGCSFYGEISIVYKSGLAQNSESVPQDIQLALWQWIESVYRKQEGNTKSENLGDYSISYFENNDPMPASAKALLDTYKKVII